MSVLDDLRQAQERVRQRLSELEPMVAEYHELRQEAERMGLAQPAAPGGERASAPATPSRGGTRAGGEGRARRAAPSRRAASPSPRRGGTARRGSAGAPATGTTGGGRSDDIVRMVNEEPGLTIREIARRLGVDPTGLYRPARQLVSSGRLVKRGTQLLPSET